MSPQARSTTSRRIAWWVLFAFNLVLPLRFGLDFTREHGRWGMSFAVAIVAVGGDFVCRKSARGGSILVWGAGVALGLLLGGLPIMAGMIGIAVTNELGLRVEGGGTFGNFTGELGGFVATIVTGGLMILAGSLLPAIIQLAVMKYGQAEGKPLLAKRPGLYDRELD